MTALDSSATGDDIDEALTRKVGEALGYDLAKLLGGDPNCGDKCPCCQLSDLVRLVKTHGVAMYRKGWQRTVDTETPAVPDLIFNEQAEVANLPPPSTSPNA